MHCELAMVQKVYTVSRKVQYKDVYRRAIEIQQHTRIFKANYCLKVEVGHIKLINGKLTHLSPKSGCVESKINQ